MFPGSVSCGIAAQLATHADNAASRPPSRPTLRGPGRAAMTDGAPAATTMSAHARSMPGFQRRASAAQRSLNELAMACSPSDARALGRAEVTLAQSTGVDDEVLQDQGGIDHPKVQDVRPRPRDDVRGHRAVDVVGRVALPLLVHRRGIRAGRLDGVDYPERPVVDR